MSFGEYDATFLGGMDLRPYENWQNIDMEMVRTAERDTFSKLEANTRIKEMFTRPSHSQRFMSSAAGLRGLNHSQSDFKYAVKSASFHTPSAHNVSFERTPSPPVQTHSAKATETAQTQDHTSMQEQQHTPTQSQSQSPADIALQNTNVLNLKVVTLHAHLLDSGNAVADPSVECALEGKFLLNSRFLSKISTDTIPIACYRRNYINLNITVEFPNLPRWIMHRNSHYLIESLFLNLSCTSNFSGGTPEISFFEPAKQAQDYSHMTSSGYSTRIQIDASLRKASYSFKRFQFKKATPNNGKFIVKDCYYLNLTLSALASPYEPSIGSKRPHHVEIPIVSLVSQPISVRGRNPSFYNNRDDVLVSKTLQL